MIIQNPPNPGSSQDAGKFLQTNLYPWMINLATGFRKINFVDNFISFTVPNLLIPANSSVLVPNQFRIRFGGEAAIPSGRIILKQSGNGLITDGVWDSNNLQQINNGSVDVTITILYFR